MSIWVIVSLSAVVVLVTAGVVLNYIRTQKKRIARDQAFKTAILEQENKRSRALMSGKDNPDAYIAEREILRLKERYAAGKDTTV